MMYPGTEGPWPASDEARVLEELSQYLRRLVPGKRRMVFLLFVFTEFAAVVRPPFRRFSRLGPDGRRRMLESWERSGWSFLNLCSLSLRSLVNLAYLSHSRLLECVGQTALARCREPVRPRRLRHAGDGTFEGVVEFPGLEGRTVRESADFVVVGTGPGGAVVARELAERGRSVVALEQGPFYRPEDHEPHALHCLRDLFAEQGLRHTRGNTPVRTFQAHALGGTSLVNSAICWRAPQSVFDGWREHYGIEGLSRETLDPYYEKAEREASVGPTPSARSRKRYARRT
jgi:hypothetical protein